MLAKTKKSKKKVTSKETVQQLKKKLAVTENTLQLANKIIYALLQRTHDDMYVGGGKTVYQATLVPNFDVNNNQTIQWELSRNILTREDLVSAVRYAEPDDTTPTCPEEYGSHVLGGPR